MGREYRNFQFFPICPILTFFYNLRENSRNCQNREKINTEKKEGKSRIFSKDL